VWFLDTYKQIIGSLVQHCLNLYLSIEIGNKENLQCEWYLLILLGDAFLGVFITYLYLYLLEEVLSGTGRWEFKSGNYTSSEGAEISCGNYLYQLAWFIVITILVHNFLNSKAKLTVLGLLLLTYKFVIKFAKFVLSPFNGNQKSKTFIVITIIPFFSNAFQFWLTDNVIMRKYNDEEIKAYKETHSEHHSMHHEDDLALPINEKNNKEVILDFADQEQSKKVNSENAEKPFNPVQPVITSNNQSNKL